MKDKLSGKIITKFVGLRTKYVENKKGTKMCVVKKKLKYEI